MPTDGGDESQVAQSSIRPPKAEQLPKGLQSTVNADRTSVTITWAGSGHLTSGGLIATELTKAAPPLQPDPA